MTLTIKSVCVWHTDRDGGEAVAQVTYSNGNVKRWYNSYCRSWPQSVSDFVDTHDGEKIDSRCVEYK